MPTRNIQRRAIVIALVPATLLALVLTAYQSHRRMHAVEHRAVEHARATAAHLRQLTREAIRRGDSTDLRNVVDSILAQNPDLAHILIISPNGEIVAQGGDRSARNQHASQRARLVSVSAGDFASRSLPSGASSGQTSKSSSAPPSPTHHARIELTIDAARILHRQRAVLWESLGLSGLALTLTIALGLRLARSVTVPVQDLATTVYNIQEEHLGTCPSTPYAKDFETLQNRIHEIAREMERRQKSLQAQMEQANTDLDSALRELENRKSELEDARVDAKAASESNSRFLANISHEIRTPLNSVVGFADLFESATLDRVQADYLEHIRESASSLLSLLNGILDLSKIDSGRVSLDSVETDLNDVLIAVFYLFAPHALRNGVEFLVHPTVNEVPAVYTDPSRLKQVLINLVSNAVKFTETGYIEVGFSTSQRCEGQVDIELWVADTGAGIPESEQQRLFQAFAQGRNQHGWPSQEAEVGTGLGLHIAREIVFLMDGSIEFQSEPGYGTTFWVTLTLPGTNDETPERATEEFSGHVWLVDRDIRVRKSYRDVIELAGFSVEATDNVEKFIPPSSASAHAPDLIVVGLPVAAEEEDPTPPAAALEMRATTPICALAHTKTQHERERLFHSGYDHILPKTPDPAQIRSGLGRLICHHSAPLPSEPPNQPPLLRAGIHRVLVIDDHPVNRELLSAYFAEDGVDVVAGASSDEAIYYVNTQRFDAILLDIHLPDRDGLATARSIRSTQTTNRFVPIIAVTADAYRHQDDRAMRAGADDLLVKPVTREAIQESVLKALRDNDGQTEAAQTPDGGTSSAQNDGLVQGDAYDHAEAVRRAAGREDVAQELFGVLLRSLPDTRRTIAEALIARDRQAVRSAAHSLRGAVAYCGVPRIEQAVQLTEGRAHESEDDDLWDVVGQLIDAIDELLELYGPQGEDENTR